MKYIVIEVQTISGTTSTLTYQFDEPMLADQQYYSILSAAAVSAVDVHSALIINEVGETIKHDTLPIHSLRQNLRYNNYASTQNARRRIPMG